MTGEYRGIPRIRPFVRYLRARSEQLERERAFQAIVTEQLRLMPQGKFRDLSMFEEEQEKPQVSGDEIALAVIKNAGLEVR